MVTVETALAIPTLMLVALAAAAVPAVVGAQIRCVDAARDAALLVSRDAEFAHVQRALRRQGLPDAHVSVARGPSTATAAVAATVHPLPGPLAGLVGIDVSATAAAPLEQRGER